MEMTASSATGLASEEDNGSSIFRKCQRPVILKFDEVVYKIKTKEGDDRHGAKERTILKGISGVVLPGEMLAMMGPSGSGKTTLLTALGGRLKASSLLTGAITYNGATFSSSLKRNMGFVSQDDVLYPHLTVAETLLYTALLRLPGSITKQEKAAHVETVIAQLGMNTCRNSLVGGGIIRGVSGGERKRVSIGQEMLIDPGLLLLDEPTSGLDATTAQRIVSVVGELAKGGRTVVMTIHQPSSRLFYLFHKVLLLSDGNPVYFGPQPNVMEYFSSIGHSPAIAMNPADFILDLANGIASYEEEATKDHAAVKEELVSAYNLRLKDNIKEELRGTPEQYSQGSQERRKKEVTKWSNNWWVQFSVLIRRDLRERKHDAFDTFTVIQVVAVALVTGALWWKSTKLQDQVGLLFFAIGFWGSFPIYQAIFAFPQERLMLTKERSSGMYRLSSYFMARMIVDLPMLLILPTIFTTIIYWMGGLKPSATSFLLNLAVTLFVVLVTHGFGLALGAVFMSVKAATTLASVCTLAMMLAGGFYVQHVPKFIAWIKYVSYVYYSFKLLLTAQFDRNETYECGNNMRCRVADYPTVQAAGLGDQGLAIGVLFAMFLGFRVVAYLSLTRIGVAT